MCEHDQPQPRGLALDADFWKSIDYQNELNVESNDDEETEPEVPLADLLAEWHISHNISLTATGALLKILKAAGNDVPLDARTLLQTPRSGTLSVVTKSGGDYAFFGVAKGMQQALATAESDDVDSYELSMNIDGLPVFKSRNVSVWPIQVAITNIQEISNKPFVVAVYCGGQKPQNSEFLLDTIAELKQLVNEGLNGKSVNIKNIICDSPARALVKGTVQFNGKYGCDFCDVKGEWDGRMTFLYEGSTRTNDSFRNETNKEHHKTESAFLELDIDMVKQFPIDPMHSVDLGTMKRMALLWKEGPLIHRLSSGLIKRISHFQEDSAQYFPYPGIFNRKPRSLDELRMWKATEFRTFLLYTGPVILKHVLNKDKYEHFLSLSVAMSILYAADANVENREYAKKLLRCFVNQGRRIYGNHFLVYKLHHHGLPN